MAGIVDTEVSRMLNFVLPTFWLYCYRWQGGWHHINVQIKLYSDTA